MDVNTATFRMLASIGAAYATGALRIDERASPEQRQWLADTLGKLGLMHGWSEMMGEVPGLHLELRAPIDEVVTISPLVNAPQD